MCAGMSERTHPFFDMHTHGFVRVATSTPKTRTADVPYNVAGIIEQAQAAHERHVDLLLYPEMCLSSYALDDLHMQAALLEAVEAGIETVRAASEELTPVLVIGAPLRRNGRMYNCAVVIARGEMLGAVPKSYLPNYREFYEKRWFARGSKCRNAVDRGRRRGSAVRHRPDLRRRPICPASPSASRSARISGAPIRPALWPRWRGRRSCSTFRPRNITIGKSDERHMLCRASSSRSVCAYAYSAAGLRRKHHRPALGRPGHDLRTGRSAGGKRAVRAGARNCASTDVDTRAHSQRTDAHGHVQRCRRGCRAGPRTTSARIGFEHACEPGDVGADAAEVARFPFVPNRIEKLDQDCYEAFNIQVDGLMRRIAGDQGANRW